MHLIVLLYFITSVNTFGQQPEDACYQCHLEIDQDQDADDRLFKNYLQDIHVQRGFGCADCHGGDPEAFDDEDAAMWDNDSYLGELSPLDEVKMCAKCHSNPTFMSKFSVSVSVDQESQYWSSKHGQELKQGNEKVATCSDCHGVHGILATDNPNSAVYDFNVPKTCSKCHSSKNYMAGLLDKTDQYDDYVNSVHGVALLDKQDVAAPACNDCHGNHGAAPPEIGSIKEICGSCHAQNRDLFQKSHLNKIFKDRGIPQCESCHGNHRILKPSDNYLKWDGGVCVKCHPAGGKPKLLAAELFNILDSLNTQLESANLLVEQAEIKGMEISELYFSLEEAHNALIHSRTAVHSFNKDFLLEAARPGLTASADALAGAQASLNEFDFRRKGLFGASLIFSFLALLLYLKIKQVESSKRKDTKHEK
ncbi:MAG: cytochrome c3 family protein [Candidatus Marinimicrobia bacterium]|nr:cytochrome c3 family protein [Candidatus Neomarinimicrobiota bacterium]